MPTVTLHPLFHRGLEVIAIETPATLQMNAAIRKIAGVKWSQTHKVWYLPLNKENHQRIATALIPMAIVDNFPLKTYLQRQKGMAATHQPSSYRKRLNQVRPPVASSVRKLCPDNLTALDLFYGTATAEGI